MIIVTPWRWTLTELSNFKVLYAHQLINRRYKWCQGPEGCNCSDQGQSLLMVISSREHNTLQLVHEGGVSAKYHCPCCRFPSSARSSKPGLHRRLQEETRNSYTSVQSTGDQETSKCIHYLAIKTNKQKRILCILPKGSQ